MSWTDEVSLLNVSVATVFDEVDYVTAAYLLNGSNDESLLRQQLQSTRLIINKVLAPTIVVFGLLGNALTIAILTRRWMASSTNCYLSVLAVYDSIYLLFALTMTLIHYEAVNQTSWYIHYQKPIGRPIVDIASNTAVILTVTFTIERYISVKFPLKGKIWCTVRRARHAVLVECFLSAAVTIPEFLEFHVIYPNGSDRPRCLMTEFGGSAGYQLGYNYANQTLFTFLPLTLLFIFNALLIRTLIVASNIRRALTTASISLPVIVPLSIVRQRSRQGSDAVQQQLNQRHTTIVLCSVVVVFLLCQLPQAVLKLYIVYVTSTKSMTLSKQLKVTIASNYCNLLVMINASVNFVLYSAFSMKFRHTFRRLFSGSRQYKWHYNKCIRRPLYCSEPNVSGIRVGSVTGNWSPVDKYT